MVNLCHVYFPIERLKATLTFSNIKKETQKMEPFLKKLTKKSSQPRDDSKFLKNRVIEVL